MYRLEHKSIIAMKGHPFTRKTEIAKYIASSLGFPILSLDDFLTQTPTSFPNTQDLAFGIMCRIAKSNLSKGFVQRIVIDSPLSSRSHLNQLIQLAESTHQTRLLIVECKSDNIYEWQTKLEEYLDQHPSATRSKWWCEAHKNWDDVEREIRDAYDERSDGYNIPKLLIDPLSLYDGSISYTDSSLMSPLLGAVRYMVIVTDVVGPDLVVYDLWRQGHYHTSGWSDVNNKCRGGSHYIEDRADHGLGLQYESVCSACQKQLVVGAAAYTCKQCSFALHKECAELLDDVVDDSKPYAGPPPTDDLNRLLRKGFRDVYPDLNFRCSWCEEEEEKDTNAESNASSCKACLFTTHVKSRVMPTVVRHECHHDVLSAELSDLNPYGKSCNCKACGVLIGECVWYSCKICDIKYHYSCLTQLPLRVEHEHGGHHHHMLMQFSGMEEEDYLCQVCFERELPERRDPSCWFYSCHDCQYIAHLNCVCDGKT